MTAKQKRAVEVRRLAKVRAERELERARRLNELKQRVLTYKSEGGNA